MHAFYMQMRAVEAGDAEVDGPVVLYLPQLLTPSEATFARAVCGRSDSTAILGLTGVGRADDPVRSTVRAVTGQDAPDGPRPPIAHHIRHHSDSDDEVRGAVHQVLDALHRSPAHRIAVLYPTARPYARLLHEHLVAAGVQVNGASPRSTNVPCRGVCSMSWPCPRTCPGLTSSAHCRTHRSATRRPGTGFRSPGGNGSPDWPGW